MRTATMPMPYCLALSMAICMARLPMTWPMPLCPSITAVVGPPYPRWQALWKKYLAGGGKLRIWISQPDRPPEKIPDEIEESVKAGANAVYIQGHKVNMGIAQGFDTTDFHVEAIDLLTNRVSCDAGVALVIAIHSALKKHPSLPALVILGDLSIQGNIKPVRSLSEALQIALENGARRALIPIENKRHFLEVSADIMERVDPIFFGDPLTAAMKALGMN